jgi:hypothetical protein
MSSKDKTRAKLMGSMRKTKADAGIGTDKKSESTAASQAAAPESAKPAAKKASSRATRTSQPRTMSTDGYQSGRRVWPD